MKGREIVIASLFIILMTIINCIKKSDFAVLKAPYLGQKPPGTIPEVFAPGLVSTRDHKEFSCTFSPDGREFYFNRGGNILMCRYEKNEWKEPVRASFDTDFMDHEPHIPAAGSK
jgi:hypothetical protein